MTYREEPSPIVYIEKTQDSIKADRFRYRWEGAILGFLIPLITEFAIYRPVQIVHEPDVIVDRQWCESEPSATPTLQTIRDWARAKPTSAGLAHETVNGVVYIHRHEERTETKDIPQPGNDGCIVQCGTWEKE